MSKKSKKRKRRKLPSSSSSSSSSSPSSSEDEREDSRKKDVTRRSRSSHRHRESRADKEETSQPRDQDGGHTRPKGSHREKSKPQDSGKDRTVSTNKTHSHTTDVGPPKKSRTSSKSIKETRPSWVSVEPKEHSSRRHRSEDKPRTKGDSSVLKDSLAPKTCRRRRDQELKSERSEGKHPSSESRSSRVIPSSQRKVTTSSFADLGQREGSKPMKDVDFIPRSTTPSSQKTTTTSSSVQGQRQGSKPMKDVDFIRKSLTASSQRTAISLFDEEEEDFIPKSTTPYSQRTATSSFDRGQIKGSKLIKNVDCGTSQKTTTTSSSAQRQIEGSELMKDVDLNRESLTASSQKTTTTSSSVQGQREGSIPMKDVKRTSPSSQTTATSSSAAQGQIDASKLMKNVDFLQKTFPPSSQRKATTSSFDQAQIELMKNDLIRRWGTPSSQKTTTTTSSSGAQGKIDGSKPVKNVDFIPRSVTSSSQKTTTTDSPAPRLSISFRIPKKVPLRPVAIAGQSVSSVLANKHLPDTSEVSLSRFSSVLANKHLPDTSEVSLPRFSSVLANKHLPDTSEVSLSRFSSVLANKHLKDTSEVSLPRFSSVLANKHLPDTSEVSLPRFSSVLANKHLKDTPEVSLPRFSSVLANKHLPDTSEVSLSRFSSVLANKHLPDTSEVSLSRFSSVLANKHLPDTPEVSVSVGQSPSSSCDGGPPRPSSSDQVLSVDDVPPEPWCDQMQLVEELHLARTERKLEVDVLQSYGELTCMEIDPPEEGATDQYCKQTLNQDLIIVLDTNVLLSHLDYIKHIRSHGLGALGFPVVLIPWVVLQELDSLKRGRGLSGSVAHLATPAISYIYNTLKNRDPRLWGQSMQQASLSSNGLNAENNDDRVLQCCLQYQSLHPESALVLCTNDKNLCSKSLLSGVKAFSKADLEAEAGASRNGLHSVGTPPPPPPPLLRTQPSLQVPEGAELPGGVLMKYEQQLDRREEKAEGRLNLSECISEFEGSLKVALSDVLQVEMKAAFDELWLEIVLVKPPWTLDQVLQCLKKHWIAVFGQIVPRSNQQMVLNLMEFFNSGPGVDRDALSSALQDAKELLKAFKKSSALVPSAISTVDQLLRRFQPQGDAHTCDVVMNDAEDDDDDDDDDVRPPEPRVSHQDVWSLFESVWCNVYQLSLEVFKALAFDPDAVQGSGPTGRSPQPPPQDAVACLHRLSSTVSQLLQAFSSVLSSDSSLENVHSLLAVIQANEIVPLDSRMTTLDLLDCFSQETYREKLRVGGSQLLWLKEKLQSCSEVRGHSAPYSTV